MIKSKHRVLSLVLVVLLALSALCVSGLSALAATTDNAEASAGGTIVYLKNTKNWNPVKVHYWGGSEESTWTGVNMHLLDGTTDVYWYEVPEGTTGIVFNGDGNGDLQTGDLNVYDSIGKIYDPAQSQWLDYTPPSVQPSTGTGQEPTQAPTQAPTQTPTAPSGENVVYVQNDAGWSDVYVYMWIGGTETNNKGWPGEKMSDLGDGLWCYEVPKSDFNKIIFNPGGDNGKTGDLDYPGSGHIYNNSTGKWDIYNTSPLRVTGFTTDAASPQYTGMDITLSASAKSSAGDVSYRFTATNPSGTTVILSNYGTASSVVWTPTVVGTYTLTVDVKDTAGNEDKRTMSYTVTDPTSLVKPLIMAVKPGDNGQVQVNTTATVTVTAGGGNTGTKLLFYKYIVTDPDGVKNTPYYSLSNTYQLTPAKLGKYTVQVYVQGSDNQTVNKTYTYSSVSDAVPTNPTTPTETLAPTTEPPTTEPPTTEPPTTEPVGGEYTYVDSGSSITVVTDVNATLVVTKKTDSDSISKANAVIPAGEKLVALFDISLMSNGVVVQPDGNATVKIPADKDSKIYRIESNGTRTDMNAVYSNGYLVFTTSHFSLYAVVGDAEAAVYELGDVDHSGKVDVKDAAYIQLFKARLLSSSEYFDESLADYDKNGVINIIDAAQIQLVLARLI